MSYVYLIHFTKPVGRCYHYLGRTYLDPEKRLRERHLTGNGAKLLDVARLIPGNEFTITRIWQTDTYEASYILEQILKTRHQYSKFCPVCNPETAMARANYPKYETATDGGLQP